MPKLHSSYREIILKNKVKRITFCQHEDNNNAIKKGAESTDSKAESASKY